MANQLQDPAHTTLSVIPYPLHPCFSTHTVLLVLRVSAISSVLVPQTSIMQLI